MGAPPGSVSSSASVPRSGRNASSRRRYSPSADGAVSLTASGWLQLDRLSPFADGGRACFAARGLAENALDNPTILPPPPGASEEQMNANFQVRRASRGRQAPRRIHGILAQLDLLNDPPGLYDIS